MNEWVIYENYRAVAVFIHCNLAPGTLVLYMIRLKLVFNLNLVRSRLPTTNYAITRKMSKRVDNSNWCYKQTKYRKISVLDEYSADILYCTPVMKPISQRQREYYVFTFNCFDLCLFHSQITIQTERDSRCTECNSWQLCNCLFHWIGEIIETSILARPWRWGVGCLCPI